MFGGSGKTQAEPRKVSCGNAHTVVLVRAAEEEGTKLVGWGNNRYNALGMRKALGDRFSASKADQILGIHWPCTMRVFEEAESSQKKKPHSSRHFVEVACGNNHSVVLENLEPTQGPTFSKTRLMTCGNNSNGQLGQGATESEDDAPKEVKFPVHQGFRVVVQRIACGADHTFAIVTVWSAALMEPGRLFAWGLGSYGALGIGSWADCFTPTEVWFPEEDAEAQRRVVSVYQVAAGTKHSVALTTTGSVFTWGHGGHGRLGLGQAKIRGQNSYSAEFEPRLVTSLQGVNITYVAAGEAHTAAVDQLGGLYTWGQGAFGRCGHGVGTDMPSPARVESLSGLSMSQVALGLMHSVTMSVKGQLYTWGKGAATGFDVGEVIPTPRQVKLESRDPVYQIAAGPLHTVVLMQKGDILCFGSGTEGRLPFRDYDGSVVDFPLPTMLNPPDLKLKGWAAENDKAIQASQSQNREATWWPSRMCCGSGSSAILTGTGEVPPGGMPYENLWLWGSQEIASVGDRTELEMMMEDDGTVQTVDKGGNCWLAVPLKTGVRNRTVRSVAMGYEHCLIVTADSLMYSWGNGSKGQLGTGSMMPADTPQFITNPTDVLHVAAGEEHSACLIEGGACFTWGNAAGGRLGLGSCLSDGEQLIPKRVVIEATELRLLRGVNCGSQHSALVTQDGKLLTFGTGWFGRLGHGDMKNEYVPALVPMSTPVKEVHCAMYHTCIVDSKDHLWVCGRDSSLCRDAQNHVLSPILFEPFQHEGEIRCVRSLAACEQHTLVATYRQNNPDDTELWVWGKNDRGQLGLPSASPVIDLPWRLQIPELQDMRERRGRNYTLTQVATGVHHSMCIAMLDDPRGQRKEPVVYAWGFSGSGRLGLELDVDNKLEMLQIRERNKGLPPERTQTTGPKHLRIYPPMKVEERWKPKVRESNQSVAEDAAKLDEPSNTWSDCQRKLFEEKADCKLKALQDRERQVKRMCDGHLDFIYKMWDKPDSRSDPCEYELRHLRKELEVDYIRTLHAMNLDGSGEGPQMENAYWVKTDPEIKGKLCKFEELVWILQQQPVYMARLSAALRKGSLQEADNRTFRTMCERIYHDLFQPRTVHLFKSMLSLIIKSEMQQAKFLHDLFDPFKSHAASLFTQLSTHSAFVEGMVLPILNPQVETSLVSTIIRYTLLKRDGETPRVLGTEAAEHSHVTGVFTTHYPEYQELVKKANADKAAHPGKTSQKSYLYSFQNELADLQRACGKEPATSGYDSKDVHAGCITSFIEHFVMDLLAEDCAKDFRMLLVCAFKTMLNDCPAAKGFEESDPRVCTPLASLVLGNIIGSVLETVGHRRYSLVELSIRKQVLEMFSNMQRRKGRPKGDLEVDPNDVAEQLYDRVLFNIQALAKIFKRCVHRGVFRLQFTKGKGDEVLKEEPESLKVCEDIKDFTCHVLHKMLMKDLSKSELEELKSGRGRPDEAVADLAGELYSDLYMSHLTLEKTTVSMSTLEMLEMANLLWRQRQELIQSGDTQDMFRTTLEEVMRKRQVAAGKNFSHGTTTEEIQEYHPDGHLWLAGKHGEWHNLRPRARFLEYMRGPGYEPTFCNESKAPMPRCLASEAQRKQKDYSLIRLFSIPEEEKGPIFTNQDGERVFVYEALEELLQILAGSAQEDPDLKYQINGSSLMDLRNSFVKIQKAMMQDIKDGNASSRMRGTVMDLEDGRNMVGLLQNQVTSTAKELMAYIDAVVQNRFKHARYLEETKTRNTNILETRKNYEEILQEQVDTMKRVVRAAQNCDCPSLITLAAGQRSEKIAFLRIRRIKQRNRKQKPTPGQKAIDMMGMEEAEVKVQELRESFVPSQSFTLGQLESKGVLVRIHDGIASKTRKHICFNFRAGNEGFDVQIFVPKAKLKEAEDRIQKEFHISRQQIEDLEGVNKTAASSYAGDLLWMNGYRLRRLLTWIVVDNGV